MSYNHHSALSPLSLLGNGWAITSNYIYRDINYTVSNTQDDTFKIVLNGISSELVYVPSENRYHTKHETYLFIEKKSGSPNIKKEYWSVKDKEGTVYRFGYSQDSELVSNQENYVSQWHLDSIKDAHGNEIIYTYDNTLDLGISYPKEISYSNGINRIKFEYVENLNQRELYSNGIYIKQLKLLNSIRIENSMTLVRKYEFGYSQSGAQNLLIKIHETGSDGTSKLPPVTFNYNIPEPGWAQDSSYTIPNEAFFGADLDEGVRMFDVNGDGLTDITKMFNSNDLSYWLNTGKGWGQKQTIINFLSGGFVSYDYSDEGVRFIDMNGDAKTDVIKLLAQSSSPTRELKVNTGNGFASKSINLPEEIIFTLKGIGECAPLQCESGWNDLDIACDDISCTRTCSQQTLVCGKWDEVFESEGDSYNNKDSENDDSTDSYRAASGSKCYAYVVDTPNNIEMDINENECKSGKSYDGQGVFISGLEGENENSWLKTVPQKNENEKWYGNPSEYPDADFIYSYITSHKSGEKSFDKQDIDDFAKDDEIIYCAPSQEICANSGLGLCGYGCYGQSTKAFVQSGYYRDRGNWFETIARDNECDDENVEDHKADYTRLEVHEGSLIPGQTIYEQNQCLKSSYVIDVGIRTIDVNGDGRTDLLKSTADDKKVWINDGNNFVLNNSWVIPNNALFLNANDWRDSGLRLADVNGDGLVDFVKGNPSDIKTWLNTGKGWVQKNSWNVPGNAVFINEQGESTGVVIEDVNGDGLNDLVKSKLLEEKIVWINNGKGWIESNAWRLPLDANLASVNTQLADINGDGISDVIKADSADRRTWINKASQPYLLKEINNEYGGKINIDYKPISSFDNTGIDQISDIAIPGWLVSSTTLDNGMSGEHYISSSYTYQYADGLFDSKSREFSGFNIVTEILPDGARVEHTFAQGEILKGLELKTLIQDKNLKLHKKIENQFETQLKDNYYIIKLKSLRETEFGDNEADVVTQTDLSYDEFGNIINVLSKGNTMLSEDDKSSSIEYVYNRNLWIVSTPKHLVSFNKDGEKVAESWLSYDNLAYDRIPIKGDVTKEEHWLDTGGNTFMIYMYDQYGNLVSEEDSLRHITRYTYDPTHTFIIKSTNAKNQETNYEYDIKTGNLLSETDPNSYRTRYIYDVFGRLIKEVRPYDSEQYPTQLTEYAFDGNAPERIIIKQRETSGQLDTYDEIYYYDGFGNLVQIKEEAENSRYGVHNLFYDLLGRDKLIANPYLEARNNEYSQQSNELKGYTYSYDNLGRIIKITNPDNTEKRFVYTLLTTTNIDENNHQIKYRYDAYDNIIDVFEYNQGEEYETQYTYDTNSNLVKIRDNERNEIRYNYDSLGRKIQLSDPDLGIWTYSYDAAGNLARQTDNKGNTISYVYDELNRPVRKTTLGGVTAFVYDREKAGTLSSVSSPEVITIYSYDERLRTTRESSTVNGQIFATTYEYDAIDRVTKKILPNSEAVSIVYNEQGSVDSLRGSKPVIENIDYNEIGLPLRKLYANSLATNYEYNPITFRLKKITTTNVQDLRYTHDEAGNIIGIVDLENDNVRSIRYDDLDRVTYVESRGDNQDLHYRIEYIYDSIGNMISTLYQGKYLIEYVYDKIIHAPSKLKIQNLQNSEGIRAKKVADDSYEILPSNETIEQNIPKNTNSAVESPIVIRQQPPSGLAISEITLEGSSKSAANRIPIKEICNGIDDDENNEIDEGSVCQPKGDFNKDEKVDFSDFFMLSDVFNLNTTSNNWISTYGIYDLNADGKINYDDHLIFIDEFNKRRING